jgi:hypothetical protein
MSYWALGAMNADSALTSRVSACAEQEGIHDPQQWTAENIAAITATPGWAETWAAAVLGGTTDPGRDGSVITREAILAAIRAHRPTEHTGALAG